MPLYRPDNQTKQFSRISLGDSDQYGIVIGAYKQSYAQSAGGPVGSRGYFYPITIQSTVIAYRFWYSVTGTVAASSTVDFGVYAEDGVRIISSGTVAHANTAIGILYADCVDTPIPAGSYYFGYSSASNSIQFTRYDLTTAAFNRAMGQRTQTSAHPLPGTATFSNANQSGYIPLMGIDVRNF